MHYIASAMASPPHPRTPKSLAAVIVQTLLLAMFIHPIPAANATIGPIAASNSSPVWAPPIEGAVESDVLSVFIPPDMPWSAAHRGIDIAASGTTVVAPKRGEVTFVGIVVDRPVISIRHPDGLVSSFEPVESDLAVGDSVTQGQVIGTITTEHQHCETQCVHWGVRKPDAWHVGSTLRDLYIDPAFMLGWSEPSILWPIHTDPRG